MSKIEKILEEVHEERKFQDLKWGEQNHNPVEWMAILTEEVGEASKEAVDYHFKNNLYEGQYINATLQAIRLKDYRKELIQVAAVAVSMVESLDRNELSL